MADEVCAREVKDHIPQIDAARNPLVRVGKSRSQSQSQPVGGLLSMHALRGISGSAAT